MNEDNVVSLDSYRTKPSVPARYPPEFHSLRGWYSVLWPSAAFLAFMFAGDYLIGGWLHHMLWVAISLAMIAWSVFGILSPRAEEWVEPDFVAIHRRNTRQWSIVSLLLWIVIAGYTIFTLAAWA